MWNTLGEEISYDSLGRQTQLKSFEHFITDDADGCHEIRTVICKTKLHVNGRQM